MKLCRLLPLLFFIGCGDDELATGMSTSPTVDSAASPITDGHLLDSTVADVGGLDAWAPNTADSGAQSPLDMTEENPTLDAAVDRDAARPVDMASDDASHDAQTERDGAPPICVEGAIETRPCGLNGVGEETRRCVDDAWTEWAACVDPDLCVNGAVELIPCGDDERGRAERTCVDGRWTPSGACVPPCEHTLCGDACIDLAVDPAHCGACDNRCARDARCCDGACVPKIHGAAPPLATLGACDQLQYGTYVHQGGDAAVNLLPDFSFAGYRGGGVPLPTVPERRRVEPGEGDDRARIQAAIDAVSALELDADGFRGAVVLTPGAYEVDGPLTIEVSGVVLRGAGQGRDGTVITTSLREKHDLIQVHGGGRGLGEVADTRTAITDPLVAVGVRSFSVAATESFAVGDTVVVLRTPNDAWINALRMAQFGWNAEAYTIGHERTVTAVGADSLTVDIPIVDALEARFGGGAVYLARPTGRITHVGVEQLRLVSEYDTPTDEEHGWNGVSLRRVVDGWVRGVTVQNFGFAAVKIADQSNFNTVQEVAMLDPISQITGGRRYSFYVSGGLGNLFNRCYSRGGRHNFVTGSRVTGPNVWLDSVAVVNHNDDGPHHRWATGLLFDNVVGDELAVQNRRNSGTGHGWAGAQVMFWNTRSDRLISDAPLGAMNWAVGYEGDRTPGRWSPGEPDGWEESPNVPVAPRSLYLQQLADRLGPMAVAHVTTPEQAEGRIWRRLEAWAGEGALADVELPEIGDPGGPDPECRHGVRAGNVCCEARCGACGGAGCGSRPGGAQACCSGAIREAGRSCGEHPAPCLTEQ